MRAEVEALYKKFNAAKLAEVDTIMQRCASRVAAAVGAVGHGVLRAGAGGAAERTVVVPGA